MKHVQNAEAFSRLVDFCTGYGGKYNPGRQTLQIETLVNQLKVAHETLANVIKAKTQYDNEVNKRRQVFDQLPTLASSILRVLESSGATPEKLKDVRSFVQQITGSKNRKSVATPEGPKPEGSRAKLQLAYVSKAEAFAKIVEAIASEPLYVSHEKHLSVKGLRDKLSELTELNERVFTARVNWSNARIVRNDAMYFQAQSVAATLRAVKKYIRGVFGHDSEQYAQVKVLNFIKPAK